MPKIASSSTSVKASPSRCRRRQTVYRRNWAAYNAGLKQRGSLTVWLTPDALKYDQCPTQRRSSYTYSDLAIQTALMMRLLYPLPLRQNRGLSHLDLGVDGIRFRGARLHPLVEAPSRLKGRFAGSIAHRMGIGRT